MGFDTIEINLVHYISWILNLWFFWLLWCFSVFVLGYFHCSFSSLCIYIIGELINFDVYTWLTLIFSLFLVFISWIFSFSPNRDFIFSFFKHFLANSKHKFFLLRLGCSASSISKWNTVVLNMKYNCLSFLVWVIFMLPHSSQTSILNPSCALMRARVDYKIRFDHPVHLIGSATGKAPSHPATRLLDFCSRTLCGVPTLVWTSR